jgi:hypothetical protein
MRHWRGVVEAAAARGQGRADALVGVVLHGTAPSVLPALHELRGGATASSLTSAAARQ